MQGTYSIYHGTVYHYGGSSSKYDCDTPLYANRTKFDIGQSYNRVMTSDTNSNTVPVRISRDSYGRLRDEAAQIKAQDNSPLRFAAGRGVAGIIDVVIDAGLKYLHTLDLNTQTSIVKDKHIIIFDCPQSRIKHSTVGNDGRQTQQPSIRQGENMKFGDIEVEFRWTKGSDSDE